MSVHTDVSTDLAAAAAAYAEQGVPVFPCHPGEKNPVPANGLDAATTDLGVVRGWWSGGRDLNIAMPTGRASGYDVLDVDVKGDAPGWHNLRRLQRAGLADGAVAMVDTPSGGRHLYFPASGLRNTTRTRLGLDIRGDRGYVLLPPSRIGDGSYELRWRSDGGGAPLRWDWCLELLEPRPLPSPRGKKAGRGGKWFEGLVRKSANAAEGERNAVLHWACCRAQDEGVGDADWDRLAEAGERAGLDPAEITSIIERGRAGQL